MEIGRLKNSPNVPQGYLNLHEIIFCWNFIPLKIESNLMLLARDET